MYDKTVRRRRAVLGLLVASSLILLTAYFGESAGGGLHSIQRGALEVVSPIQEGASRALKPFRDLFGWAGDTLDAKGEVEDLRRERDALRLEAVNGATAVRENAALKRQLDLNERLGFDDDGPVAARVIGKDPSVWFSQIVINKGTSDGVQADHPVMTGEGLVGVVSSASPNSSVVRLITDHTTSVSARVSESGVTGMVEVEAGRPSDLALKYTRRTDIVEPGQVVVTAGTSSNVERLRSLFPPGIPVGRVTRVDDPATDDQEARVRPFADIRRLEFVQVLTRTSASTAP